MDQNASSSPPAVLVFAASDPSGGAGIQADIMTLSSMGCHPLTVLTAITVQDTLGVSAVYPLDAEWIEDQARTVLEDMPVAAFKIGLVGSVEAVSVIAEIVSDYPDIPVILDPVLASGRGDELATEEILAAIREMLLPQTTVLTPNSQEVRRLAEEDGDEGEEGSTASSDLASCAQRLISEGCAYVLVTGTHESTPRVINTLYGENGQIRSDRWERLPAIYHGSGCTLASAIAALLANGQDVDDAVREAQEYTWQTLANGFRPGMGQHLPDRFFWARNTDAGDSDEPSKSATPDEPR